MKDPKHLRKTLCMMICLLQCWAIASAQLVRPRKPTEPVIKAEPKPYTPAPTAGDIDTATASPIRNVSVGTNMRNVLVSFSAFPNTVPIVELGSVKPVVRTDGWKFPNGSWSITRPAGGDKEKGHYFVDMNQELEPGATYYYIITASTDQGPSAKRAQITGKFSVRNGMYLVRYKGFVCTKTTDGPGSDEIYLVFTGVSPSNALEFATTVDPRSGVFEDVRSGKVYRDQGRVVSWGDVSTQAYLSVMLIEYDYGDSDRASLALEAALAQGLAAMAFNAPITQLTGVQLAHAMYGASIAAASSLDLADDVIGVVTRNLSAAELEEMTKRPASVENGIQYDFFTDHRGHGGVYRVYFDVIDTR